MYKDTKSIKEHENTLMLQENYVKMYILCKNIYIYYKIRTYSDYLGIAETL